MASTSHRRRRNGDADVTTPSLGATQCALSKGYPTYEGNVRLAEKLGRDLVELPGGHTGYAPHPAEFAQRLVQALEPAGYRPAASRAFAD